jgi:RNA polymerase sigma-70 factor (ECF subfamily)
MIPMKKNEDSRRFPVTFRLSERLRRNMDRYRAFYNDHKDKLFSYLMRMTGDYDLAGDLMQESFTRYLESYWGRPQSVALLYTIARNVFFDNVRGQNRRRALDGEEQEQTRDQEQLFLVREEYRRVLSAMGHLEASERETLALAVSSDLSYGEIASVTATSEANVKVRVHRARQKLKKILNEGGA